VCVCVCWWRLPRGPFLDRAFLETCMFSIIF
jgi:hypothetical protein